MTALQFESRYHEEWVELETLLNLLPDNPREWYRRNWASGHDPLATARLAELYDAGRPQDRRVQPMPLGGHHDRRLSSAVG